MRVDGREILGAWLLLAACDVRPATEPAPAPGDSQVAQRATPTAAPVPRDLDGDGVVASDDRCVDQAEVVNGFNDSDGCPDEIPEDLAAVTGVLHGVAFEIDKDVLRPSSVPTLDRVVAALRRYPEVRVEVSAHTTPSPYEAYGRAELTVRRARAVVRYFVEKGIARERLEPRGAADSEPIDTNKTEAGRARNRRLEVKILAR